MTKAYFSGCNKEWSSLCYVYLQCSYGVCRTPTCTLVEATLEVCLHVLDAYLESNTWM